MSPRSFYEVQADLCRCMSSPVRILIIHLLRGGPKHVGEIVQLTSLPQPLISRHLAVLRSHGLVITNRTAREISYQITNPKIVHICDLMRQVLEEEAVRRSEILTDFQTDLPSIIAGKSSQSLGQ